MAGAWKTFGSTVEVVMTAPSFAPILEAARARLGAAALKARLPQPRSATELRAVPDDRYLSQMSLRIFRAGLKHSLVDAKWPAFEEVFKAFEPRRVRAMSDEALEALLGDARLIRHWGKLKSVRDNAAAMIGITEEHGSFGAWLADWPGTEIVELWEPLAKRFSQMGGNSGPTFLRMIGKDTFILTPSVTAALKQWGAVEAPRKNRKDRGLRAILLQCLGGRDRPAALPAEPHPRRLHRGLSIRATYSLKCASAWRNGALDTMKIP
jgi:3-methyladenine DNA glycosylase Tag